MENWLVTRQATTQNLLVQSHNLQPGKLENWLVTSLLAGQSRLVRTQNLLVQSHNLQHPIRDFSLANH